MRYLSREKLNIPCSDDEKTMLWKDLGTVLSNAMMIILVALLFMYIIIEPVVISGSSMEASIYQKDMALINKCYLSVNRGDVVVINRKDGIKIIKRVVAVGGDKIGFVKEGNSPDDNVYLYIDSGDGFVLQQENYIKEQMKYSPNYFDKAIRCATSVEEMENGEYFTVSDNCFIALGDNRNHSDDSRKDGEYKLSSIDGVMFVKLESTNIFYTIFLMFYPLQNG